MSADTVPMVPLITNDEETMGSIQSFDDAIAVLASAGVSLHSSKEFGDGFEVVDKSSLVDVPFVILGMKFSEGDYGNERFVIIHLVTKDGRKCIITDGGTGIRAQAEKYAAKGLTAGVVFESGLIRSDFRYVDDKTAASGIRVVRAKDPEFADSKPATTYYLS